MADRATDRKTHTQRIESAREAAKYMYYDERNNVKQEKKKNKIYTLSCLSIGEGGSERSRLEYQAND